MHPAGEQVILSQVPSLMLRVKARAARAGSISRYLNSISRLCRALEPRRAVMQIRALKWKGLAMWPPEWTILDEGLGEAGVLEEVHLRQDLNPKLISVVANHLGDIRRGVMVLEDPALLEAVYGTLKQQVGRPLAEIGDLEISLLPPMAKRGPKQVRSSSPPRPKSAAK
jgi:hypothetical protein